MKIAPLALLLLGACTIDVDPETPDSDEGISVAGLANADSAVDSNNPDTNAGVDAGNTDDVADNALDNSTDGAIEPNPTGQPVADQPATVQINEIAPETDSPAPSTPAPSTNEPAPITDNPVTTPPPVDIPEPPDNRTIVRIPFTDRPNAPTIDAVTVDYIAGTELLGGEWRSATQLNSDNSRLDINQYMFGEAGTNNDIAGHQWSAIHDGEFLYLLVVSDDAGNHHQDTNEASNPWKDDSIEIFIDGNHSQLAQYDGVDDFHFTINLFSSAGVANTSFNGNTKILQSERSATLPSDLIFAAGPRNGPMASNVERGRKDIYEIRINLSQLNIQVGAPFGIEVQINDDDNGGDRDAKWGWNHPEGTDSNNDFTQQHPGFMGTAILLR